MASILPRLNKNKMATTSGSKREEADFDKFLRVESQQFNQETEVKRVLDLMRNGNKDPLLVLDMPTDAYVSLEVDGKVLKKQFRFVASIMISCYPELYCYTAILGCTKARVI